MLSENNINSQSNRTTMTHKARVAHPIEFKEFSGSATFVMSTFAKIQHKVIQYRVAIGLSGKLAEATASLVRWYICIN